MKYSIYKKIIIFLVVSIIFIIYSTNIYAAEKTQTGTKDASTDSTVSISNPLGEIKNIPTLIGKVIQIILSVVGSISLVMFIYGGFVWMLAAGNEQRVQKGKDILLWSVLGLVVIFSSYAILNLVFQAMGGATK